MTWSALFGAFLLSHLTGDFLLQTDFQATNKGEGLGARRSSRRALALHGLTYMLAFVPALVWVAADTGTGVALGVAALVGLPHVVIDDGRVVALWVRRVKHGNGIPTTVVRLGVDQTFHLLALAAVALLVTG